MTIEQNHPGSPDTQLTRGGWQLQGGTAEGYERYLVPALFAPWAERLVELATPRPGERVLDVACGTGIVARLAAARVGATGAVVGVDLNDGMLEVARATADGLRPPIDWQAGDAAGLPCPDGAFELVLCQQGLQFFPDPAAALGEMRRVLAPGGRLVLAVWRPIEHSPGFAELARVLEGHAGAEVGAVMRSPFGGPDGEALRQLVAGAGFGAVRLRIGVGAARFRRPRSSSGRRRPAHRWPDRSGRSTRTSAWRWSATCAERSRSTATTTALSSPCRPGSSPPAGSGG